MKRNSIKATLLVVALLCTIGCSDNDSQSTIYIPDAGTAVKALFYIEDEPFIQPFTVAVTPESYPQLTEYGLPNDAVIHLQADLNKVSEYNQKHSTDYEALPEAAFSLTTEIQMKAGKPKSEPAAVTLRAKGNIEPFKEYLLPVSIVSVEGAQADHCCQTIYFIFRGSMDASNMELLDRKGWVALSASSEEPKEGEWGHSGLKEGCLDGDMNTFWATDWSNQHPQPPHWIVIDMKQSVHIQGFACQARDEGYDGPKELTLEVSDDNVTWTIAAKFKDIPAQDEFRSFLPEAADGRYMKITITAVNGGPHVTVSEINLF